MQVPWFFATTPSPKPPPRDPRRRPSFWSRAAERFVAWCEKSRQRGHGSLELL